ncbi:MAG: DUF86 domain-containing protein [Pseudomonadota bacterium]
MNRDRVYLQHIHDAAQKIKDYTSVGRDAFMRESFWQDAVIRQLEIIGEAAKRLSEDVRRKHQNIPWRRIAGLRDILIHDYMGVDLDAVWEISQKNIPEFDQEIRHILNTLP